MLPRRLAELLLVVSKGPLPLAELAQAMRIPQARGNTLVVHKRRLNDLLGAEVLVSRDGIWSLQVELKILEPKKSTKGGSLDDLNAQIEHLAKMVERMNLLMPNC